MLQILSRAPSVVNDKELRPLFSPQQAMDDLAKADSEAYKKRVEAEMAEFIKRITRGRGVWSPAE
ncbi:MAG: hypothetical protein HYX42_06115 [Polaromonas sp.]|uniref:hypothetical protein n=1 Tax=Polaromonas sp. TaxID=1869339 RepID=UPI0025DE8849|nr:hypothetical protein [Polaromonas sp.]MBI2725811.1 hypothetical protein [Polaromonas sp.]